MTQTINLKIKQVWQASNPSYLLVSCTSTCLTNHSTLPVSEHTQSRVHWSTIH